MHIVISPLVTKVIWSQPAPVGSRANIVVISKSGQVTFEKNLLG